MVRHPVHRDLEPRERHASGLLPARFLTGANCKVDNESVGYEHTKFFLVGLVVGIGTLVADPNEGFSLQVGAPAPAIAADDVIAGIVNGGFESDYAGWTRSGNQQISPRASEGVKAVQFNSGQTTPTGVLTQSFATTPGQSYTLGMDVGADWGTPSTQQRLQVTLQGVSTLLSRTVVVFGTGNSSSNNISTNFTFVADSASTTLTFRDVSSTGLNVDLLLDQCAGYRCPAR